MFGAGPIGLSAIATLRDRGVADVVAIDLSPRRLELAAALGARATINASEQDPWVELKKLHGEEPLMGMPMAGTDVFIEASGAGKVITDVLQGGKAESRLTVVALHEQSVNVSFMWVMMKQMTIRGAMEYPADYNGRDRAPDPMGPVSDDYPSVSAGANRRSHRRWQRIQTRAAKSWSISTRRRS